MTKRISRVLFALTCTAALLVATTALPAAMPKAFDLAPEGAHAVIVVKNIKQLEQNLDALQQKIGMPASQYGNPVTQMKQQANWTQGVNDDAPMVVALIDLPEAIEKGQDPTTLTFMPVTDYKTFMKNYQVDATDGVTQFVDTMGDTMYAREVPGYAMASVDKAAVENYKAGNAAKAMGESVGDVGVKYAQDGDIAAWVNVEALAPALQPKIKQTVDQANQSVAEMEKAGFMDASSAQYAKLMYSMYGHIAHGLVQDTRSMVFAGVIDPQQGVRMTKALAIKEDTMTAKLFPGGGKGVSSVLGSLPASDYIGAMAMDFAAVDIEQMISNMQQVLPMPAEGQGGEADGDADPGSPLAMYYMALPMLKQLDGFSQALYVPDQMAVMSGSFIRTAAIYETQDTKAFIDTYRKYLDEMNKVSYDLGPTMQGQGGQPAKMTVNTTFTPNQMQMDGVQVNGWSMVMNMPPQAMQQMGPMAMFMGAFTRYQGYIAAKGNEVMVTSSPDPALTRSVIQQMGKDDGMGAGGQTARVLKDADVPGTFFQGMVNARGIAQTANAFMQMFQMKPIDLPQDVSPLAFTAGMDRNTLTMQMMLPADMMKFVKDAVDEVQALQGGAAGGQQQRGGAQPAPF